MTYKVMEGSIGARKNKNNTLRTLFLVYFEDLPSLHCRTLAGLKQRQQKRGLREALSHYGPILEIDYRREFKKHGSQGLKRIIERAADEVQPNLILSEFHGADMVQAPDIAALRQKISGARWVNWNGDYRDPQTWELKDIELMAQFDLSLIICHDAVREYQRLGVRSRYWQIGWEPDSFGDEPRKWTPRYNVLFQANCSGTRRRTLVQALREAGFNLGLYGRGWTWFWSKGSTLYDFKQGCRLIRAAKVVLSDSQWPDADGYVSNRTFESMAAGGALVMQQYFKGFDRLGFVDAKHLVTWNDISDLIEKLRYWLRPENEEYRRAIADAGQKFCLENHSFDVRVQELVQMLAELG